VRRSALLRPVSGTAFKLLYQLLRLTHTEHPNQEVQLCRIVEFYSRLSGALGIADLVQCSRIVSGASGLGCSAAFTTAAEPPH
jgi:hypothetical protein